GLYTNRPEKNYIKITQTTSFYANTPPPAIQNATVTITSTDGIVENFLPYMGTNTDSLAFYLPQTPTAGRIGEGYTLNVEVGGQIYTASDSLYYVQPIDSLKSAIDPLAQKYPEEPGQFYQVLVFTKEPKTTKDYYLFRFYRNWVQERSFENDIYVADDFLLAENINGIPSPVYYAQNDSSVVEMYRISRKAFVYYVDLQAVLGNDGGMFSPPPANPRNNISNNALGNFTVAAIESDTLIVQ
ncbi:MAG: DUF4249 domain-containing protein, partial [Cyclobacteriaceae bacterium]|nr:DUF4249 domain-containing protein [Cyclobacteriaceae bacterium]